MSPETIPSTEDHISIVEQNGDKVKYDPVDDPPPVPFICTLYFRNAPPMDLTVTAIDPKVNPETGNLYGGTIEQKHLLPGEEQVVYIQWHDVYALSVASIEPGVRRRR